MNYQLLSVLRSRGLCTPQSCMTLAWPLWVFYPPVNTVGSAHHSPMTLLGPASCPLVSSCPHSPPPPSVASFSFSLGPQEPWGPWVSQFLVLHLDRPFPRGWSFIS